MIDDGFLEQLVGPHANFAQPFPSPDDGVALMLTARSVSRHSLNSKLDEIRAAESVEEAQQVIDLLPPDIAKHIKIKG